MRGSIAGNTFTRNTSGPIARARRVPTQPLSGVQTRSLTSLSNLQILWRNVDPGNQIQWNAFAAAHTRVNMFGKTTTLSGAQWYFVINNNRIILGQSVLDVPPTYALPAAPEFDEVIPTSGSLIVDYIGDVPPAGFAYFLYTTPFNQTVEAVRRPLFRYTDIMLNADSSPRNITTQWGTAHKFPFPTGGSVNARLQLIAYSVKLADGIPSAAAFWTVQAIW